MAADQSSLEFNGIIIKDKESLVVTAIVLGSQKRVLLFLFYKGANSSSTRINNLLKVAQPGKGRSAYTQIGLPKLSPVLSPQHPKTFPKMMLCLIQGRPFTYITSSFRFLLT